MRATGTPPTPRGRRGRRGGAGSAGGAGGGTFTRFGHVEVLYVTEFVGLLLIYAGYRQNIAEPRQEVVAAAAWNKRAESIKMSVTRRLFRLVHLAVRDRTDAELIAAVLGGDTDAFGELVRRYQHVYFRFAVRMLGNRDDADDALQSAFVRAYRSLGSCRDRDRFAAWLYQIVINECRTLAVSRQRREQRFLDIENLQEPADDVVDSDGSELEEIQRALAQLDPDQREAFVLKHVEDLEYEEMAALTGAGVSALKMRVKRARERLRQLLEPARSTQ